MLSGFFPFGTDQETGDSELLDDNGDKQPLYFPDSQLFQFYGKKYQLLYVSIETQFISFLHAMQLASYAVGEHKWDTGTPCQ